MLEQMRREHEQPPHPHESLLERAGWVTPPPPPPHPGLLEKMGLAQAPPPLAPKPAGILHRHHDGAPPPTERLTDKISALGAGLGRAHGDSESRKDEHGLVHKLSGVLHQEEKNDEGSVTRLVRKISGALRGEEKKDGAFSYSLHL